MDIEKKHVQKGLNQVNKFVKYNDITYYFGLRLQVGRKCCSPPYFICGLRIKVAHNNFEPKFMR